MMAALLSCRHNEKIVVQAYSAWKIMKNKPHFCILIISIYNLIILIYNRPWVVGALILPSNWKNISVIVLYWKIMKNEPHFYMLLKFFRMLILWWRHFYLAAESKKYLFYRKVLKKSWKINPISVFNSHVMKLN